MPDSDEKGVTDDDLVARFRAGDASAFEELVHRHRTAVYRVAHRLTGGHAEADDLAQEAFLRVYRSIGGFRGQAQFRTWIVRIVINLALNARQGRRVTVPVESIAARLGADGGALESTLRGQIRRVVATLPPRQRQVLVLKVYEGMKFVEIAAAAGMSVGTAKATFFQAVRGLQGRLKTGSARRDPEEVRA